MGKRDRRVDAHIEKAPEFAKPILEHIRDVAHAALPDVEETIKWSMPFFERGQPVAMMAAFKQHVRFGFWQGQMFERVTSIEDLPPKKELVAMFKATAERPKTARPKAKPKPDLETPAELTAALKKNRKAAAAFEAFPPSHRREYIMWITEAKTDETRKRRIDQAIEWIAEGKQRNWKYMKR